MSSWLDQNLWFKLMQAGFPLLIGLLALSRALGFNISTKLSGKIDTVFRLNGEIEAIDGNLKFTFYILICLLAGLVFLHKASGIVFARLDEEEDSSDLDELTCLEQINGEITRHLSEMCDKGFSQDQFQAYYSFEHHINFLCRTLTALLKRKFPKLKSRDTYVCFYVNTDILEASMAPSRQFTSAGSSPLSHGPPDFEKLDLEDEGCCDAFKQADTNKWFEFSKKGDPEIKLTRKMSKSAKKFRQALTIPIRVEGATWAFVRFEIHNSVAFEDENDVERFMRENFRIFDRIASYLLLKGKAFQIFRMSQK